MQNHHNSINIKIRNEEEKKKSKDCYSLVTYTCKCNIQHHNCPIYPQPLFIHILVILSMPSGHALENQKQID